MKVLVIGSGGREHAICWKLAQSARVKKIFASPGNAGIANVAECIDIKADDIAKILAFAKEKRPDVTLVGPEAPLTQGIVDKFNKEGLRVFGPNIEAAKLEASKVFAKETMARFRIPSADFMSFDDPADAASHVKKRNYPMVVKADGLAHGKGVIICHTRKEALAAVNLIMVKKVFGPSGDSVVIEDCLVGEEASIIIISDGKNFISLASSQDHKRIYDGDKGPNTGGMGAYSPAPVIDEEMNERINKKIITPLLFGMREEGTPFKGVLYAGLMITKQGPFVLEFNVRFGDPETQAILPRLRSDLMDAVEASIDGDIKNVTFTWDERPCVCVVCASGGYPANYKKGLVIEGLDEAGSLEDVVVFHAGTKLQKIPNVETSKKNNIGIPKKSSNEAASFGTNYKLQAITDGGRVLGVTALGDDIKQAIEKAYQACEKIKFKGMYYRKDIGYRALDKQNVKF